MTLTTLIIAQHARPFQPLPMLITPLLTFSSYLTLAGFPTDGAGMTAAWSGIYTLLASRRKHQPRGGSGGAGFSAGRLLGLSAMRDKFFSVRGLVRGSAMALGAANTVAGLYVYLTGDRKREEEERREMNRWGVYKD